VLLAAGAGSRFGGGKLLAPLPDGTPLGIASLRNLLACGLPVTAVVRPEDEELANLLSAEGARVIRCPDARQGMAHSLICAIRANPDAAGWIIALGDMPRVKPATIAAVAAALQSDAAIAIPFHQGRRGNPIAIGRAYREELLQLSGDVGARALFQRHATELSRIEVDDPGVLADVDTPGDLAEMGGPQFQEPQANRGG
jgi:molybdenum cofactor cytidylyltransferase